MKAGLLLVPFLIYAAFVMGSQDRNQEGIEAPAEALLANATATADSGQKAINQIQNALPQLESLVPYALNESIKRDSKEKDHTGENIMNDGLSPDQLVGPHVVFSP